jgi:hypothetical protein
MGEQINSQAENSGSHKSNNTQLTATPNSEIGVSLKAFPSEISPLKDQFRSEIDQFQLAEHFQRQLYWAKYSAVFVILLSGLSLIVTAIIAWVLWEGFGLDFSNLKR